MTSRIKKKIQITTLGCKVNQAESEAIAAAIVQKQGWHLADSLQQAGLCIINTCAVTQKAAMQSRQAIRRAIKDNPDSVVVATGCYAQNDPETIAGIKGVDYVIAQGEKHRLLEIITSLKENGRQDYLPVKPPAPVICHNDILSRRHFDPMPAPSTCGMRTRPFLKIQDGCNSFCTYCIVPYTRGPARSLPAKAALAEFKALAKTAPPEIVISGVHIGRYGRDFSSEMSLADLLLLFDSVQGDHLIRLTSIEPAEITDNLLSVIAGSKKFCPHFHVPLQSGDPKILKKMKRPYSPQVFEDRIKAINNLFPSAAIGADVIAGFPGEDDSAFEKTFKLLENLPVTYLHVFPFSPRPGTRAATFDKRVPADVIKKRCQLLRQLARRKKAKFYNQMTGKILDVGIETAENQESGLSRGLSSNYIPVHVENAHGMQGMRIACKITGTASASSLRGKAVSGIPSERAS
jgi:threonylcarbamoyladenosine tRNA methylthiotransferase MtaB